MRQRDANLTALAAIGPRKKRKVDSPGPGSGTEVQWRVGRGLEGTWAAWQAPLGRSDSLRRAGTLLCAAAPFHANPLRS